MSAPKSLSDASQRSQTAKEFIDGQLQLEADAREALPYSFDRCTQPLGALRQPIFSCLTCNSTPEDATRLTTNAGICYSCSIACHGEHELVELFNRRDFVCDCGTSRLPCSVPCTLRVDPATGMRGPVKSQKPRDGNSYNQNFRNRFCGCSELYDAHREKGTMFQCLGLATEADGGCGEDWWHPECIMGLPRRQHGGSPITVNEKTDGASDDRPAEDTEVPLPAGFPREDDFETFVCYKCLNACQWIKCYAGTPGFLPAVTKKSTSADPSTSVREDLSIAEWRNWAEENDPSIGAEVDILLSASADANPKKRKSLDSTAETLNGPVDVAKKIKTNPDTNCYYDGLPDPPRDTFSLFLTEDFRDHFCRCPKCYPQLKHFPQLLEEEEAYEPPLSNSGDEGSGSVATGSLLERGEAALSNVDRVRAIEGVMAYNHLKDKVKSFLQPFAESGQAVGAEDIKAYFEKLRGDEQSTSAAVNGSSAEAGTDNRKEQSGY